MKLAMAQISLTNDINNNFEKTIEYINCAKGSDLLFFPEIQITPFFPQYKIDDLYKNIGLNINDLSTQLNDNKIKVLQNSARENNLFLSPNLYIYENSKYYDMSIMIDNNGNLLGNSKMVHIYQAANFYEQDYYAPSEDGFKVYNTPFGNIGVVICFDRHLPESVRTCALMGADLIIIPTANTADEPMDLFEWEIRTQAYHNNVFIAMCNRVGQEGNMIFCGESLIADPNGNIIYKADNSEQLIIQDIDIDLSKLSRQNRPYINLRRMDMYK